MPTLADLMQEEAARLDSRAKEVDMTHRATVAAAVAAYEAYQAAETLRELAGYLRSAWRRLDALEKNDAGSV